MKAKKKGNEDRTSDYRDFRRYQFGDDRYVMDVDQVEYTFREGWPEPVAVIELTRSDYKVSDPSNLLEAVLKRIAVKSPQGKMLRRVAAGLGVNAYIVVFEKDLSWFYVYNLSKPPQYYSKPDARWYHLDQARYKEFIDYLHTKVHRR